MMDNDIKQIKQSIRILFKMVLDNNNAMDKRLNDITMQLSHFDSKGGLELETTPKYTNV
jgi:hypothetical protein